MRVQKSKTKFFLKKYYKYLVLIFLLIISNVFLYVKKNTNVLSNLGYKVFVETGEDTNEYEEYDGYDFPLDGYVLKDYECENDGEITQNETNKKLTFTGEVDACILTFDVDDSLSKKTLKKLQALNETIVVESSEPNFLYNSDGDRIINFSPELAIVSYKYIVDNIDELVETSFSNVAIEHKDEFISNGIFSDEDDLGTTYYWRGNVNNNYLYFAGYYWRILRINGDGTLRIVYDGMNPGDNSKIGLSRYNLNHYDNGYVGFMYGEFEEPTNCSNNQDTGVFSCESGGSLSYDEAHANTKSSALKQYLQNWYSSNLSGYSSYIADGIFCNDRKVITKEGFNSNYSNLLKYVTINNDDLLSESDNGYGLKRTYYSANYDKFSSILPEYNTIKNDIKILSNEIKPTYICLQSQDKFSKSKNIGNGKLSYEIGTLTNDDYRYSSTGLLGSANSFLSNINSTTISPKYLDSEYSAISTNNISGDINVFNHIIQEIISADNEFDKRLYISILTNLFDNSNVSDPSMVNPVINLNKSAIDSITGSGTSNDPFVVHATSSSTEKKYTSEDILTKLQNMSGDNWVLNEGVPDFSKISPATNSYYIDNNFNGSSSTNSSAKNKYFTYSSSYSMNRETGKFSLTGTVNTIQLSSSSNASTLKNKYIVNPSGTSSNTQASYTNLDTIYKVTDASYSGFIITTASIKTIPSSNSKASEIDCTECGIWKSEDDYGESYYVRGSYDYNYATFGKDSNGNEYYWRIISINGNGSVKLLYDGLSPGEGGYIGTSTTYSSSKGKLTDWYINNFLNTKYESFIDDIIYCEDNSVNSNATETDALYGSYIRNFSSNNPSLICPQKKDKFTVSDTINGNGEASYKIGQITIDEAVMAGFKFGESNANSNEGNILNRGYSYWTMSPSFQENDKTYYGIISSNYIDSINSSSSNLYKIIPVINIKASQFHFWAMKTYYGSSDIAQHAGTKTNPIIIYT